MGKRVKKRGSEKTNSRRKALTRAEIPKGMRVLIYYSILLSVFYLIMLLSSDITIFFGKEVVGLLAKTINLAVFFLLLFVIYGLLKRLWLTYYIALSLYFLSLLSSAITLVLWSGIKDPRLEIITAIIVPLIIITILVNGVTFWYLISSRSYFFTMENYSVNRTTDKVFTYSIYCFLFLFFMILAGAAVNFSLRITSSIDSMMKSINEQTLTESLFYCEDAGKDHDLCLVSVVTKFSGQQYISNICSRIDSRFYRFACYQAAG